MPKIRTSRRKPPAGFEEIEDKLQKYEDQMRDAENEVTTDKIKSRVVWPILNVSHRRSRYIFDLMEREAISKTLYDYLLKERYADANLIAKWKRQGYEKLCCTLCIQSRDHNDTKATCICRVPRAQLRDGIDVQCKTCGCRGCSSGD